MLNALIERAKALLLKPAETWDVIAGEEVEVADLYKTWIMPLAAIAPIATFIGMTFLGRNVLGMTIKTSFTTGFVTLVLTFAFALAWVYVFALIIDALAPNFGAEKNFKQAFKVSAYAPAAGWIAGVFHLLPSLSVLSVLGGLYSLYLLFIGLPKLMKPAEDKGTTYTIVAIVCAVVLAIVSSVVVGAVAGTGAAMSGVSMRMSGNDRTASRMEARSEALDDALERGDLGDVLTSVMGGASGPTVEPDALVDALPARLAGLPLTNSHVEETSAPFDVVSLTADYGRGDKSITLTITNSPALSAMRGAFGFAAQTYNRREGSSYERLRRDGDAYVIEEWDDDAERGRYGRTVGDAFMVDAAGRGVTMRDLERAVGEFGERKLGRLPTREG